MKQKLCIVLGVSMIAFVAIMVSGVAGTGDSMIKSVSTGEARLVMGGGCKGATNYSKDGGTCNSGQNGCEGTVDSYTGALVDNGAIQKEFVYCSGSCSEYYGGSGVQSAGE